MYVVHTLTISISSRVTFIRLDFLKKTPAGDFELKIPVAQGSSAQELIWIEKDFGPCVLTLFKKYQSHKESIWNQAFNAVGARMTFDEFCSALSQCTLLLDPVMGQVLCTKILYATSARQTSQVCHRDPLARREDK